MNWNDPSIYPPTNSEIFCEHCGELTCWCNEENYLKYSEIDLEQLEVTANEAIEEMRSEEYLSTRDLVSALRGYAEDFGPPVVLALIARIRELEVSEEKAELAQRSADAWRRVYELSEELPETGCCACCEQRCSPPPLSPEEIEHGKAVEYARSIDAKTFAKETE